MGRGDTYKRQRAHVMRENPKFFEIGENRGPPTRDSIIEEFHRLVADNAYGRNPKVGAERPEGGVIPMSPPLKAVDLNSPDAKSPNGKTTSSVAAVEDSAKKVKKELGTKPKPKRPQPEDIVLESKDAHNLGSIVKGENEIPTTGGFDWAADLHAHLPSSPDQPVKGDGNDGDLAPETFAEEDGWNTVRSNRSARAQRASVQGSSIENRGCFNCGQEGHRKIDCTAPPKTGARACHKCHEEGHIARDCPNQGGFDAFAATDNRACFNCNQIGHLSRDCPTGGPGKGGRECFNCGEMGHKSFECPKGGGGFGSSRFGKPGGGGGGCYKCGQPGHFARECPGGDGGGTGGFESPVEPFPAFVDAGFDTAAEDDGYSW